MRRRGRHGTVVLPTPQVGDPFPAGASDDVDCDEAGCRREPDHPMPHVAARGAVVSAVWWTSEAQR